MYRRNIVDIHDAEEAQGGASITRNVDERILYYVVEYQVGLFKSVDLRS